MIRMSSRLDFLCQQLIRAENMHTWININPDYTIAWSGTVMERLIPHPKQPWEESYKRRQNFTYLNHNNLLLLMASSSWTVTVLYKLEPYSCYTVRTGSCELPYKGHKSSLLLTFSVGFLLKETAGMRGGFLLRPPGFCRWWSAMWSRIWGWDLTQKLQWCSFLWKLLRFQAKMDDPGDPKRLCSCATPHPESSTSRISLHTLVMFRMEH